MTSTRRSLINLFSIATRYLSKSISKSLLITISYMENSICVKVENLKKFLNWQLT
jgi:hypothetical protein